MCPCGRLRRVVARPGDQHGGLGALNPGLAARVNRYRSEYRGSKWAQFFAEEEHASRIAVEPCTSPSDLLDDLPAHAYPCVPAGGSAAWSLGLEISTADWERSTQA